MKLFALCKEETGAVSKLLVRIVGTFDGILEEGEDFALFHDLKEMLPSFAKALKSGSNIVLALDKEEYNAVRKKLCAALSLKEEQNAVLLERLAKTKKISEEEKAMHAEMPQGATVFPTENGMFSGFLIEKGKQSIFFFPLEDKSLKTILKQGVAPLITERFTQKQAALQEKKAQEAPQVPEAPAQEVAPVSLDGLDVLEKTLAVLKAANAKVAISGTPGAEPVKAFAEKNPEFESYFTFTPHVEDKGEYNLTDYAALLAKSAKELTGSTYGASISEVGMGDGGDFICITVADDQTALVRKIYREENESTEAFINDAAEELLELIYEKASGKGAVGIEIANAEPPKKAGFFQTTGGKALIAILCILIAATIAVGSIFIVRERKKRADQEIASQLVVPTTEEETKKIEAPVIETMPLSQLMYKEMLEGIQETPAEEKTETGEGAAIDTSDAQTTSEIPKEIIVNGITMDAKEAVAKIVEAEMGPTYREDALKAQAVCVYTYLKYRNTNWKITGVTIAENYSDEVYNAVRSVFGEYISFEDKPAFTPYFKLSAGKTAAADSIYKKTFPYLRPVESLSDKTNDSFKTELIFPAEEVKNMLLAYDANLEMSENPKDWIQVKAHNAAVNTGVGYVDVVSVCGKEISGTEFVQKIFTGKNIPSTCFEVTYNKTTSEFKITAYGNGLGVGMSQAGADKMAATGSNYVQILAKFFPGTKISV